MDFILILVFCVINQHTFILVHHIDVSAILVCHCHGYIHVYERNSERGHILLSESQQTCELIDYKRHLRIERGHIACILAYVCNRLDLATGSNRHGRLVQCTVGLIRDSRLTSILGNGVVNRSVFRGAGHLDNIARTQAVGYLHKVESRSRNEVRIYRCISILQHIQSNRFLSSRIRIESYRTFYTAASIGDTCHQLIFSIRD